MRPLVPWILVGLVLCGCRRGSPEDERASRSPVLAQAVIPPAAIAPDMGRPAGAPAPPTGIVVNVDGAPYSFSNHCHGHAGGSDGLAAGGAILKPRRPQQIWITGCDDRNGYFHAVLSHGPTVGPAAASLFVVTLPGGAQQDVRTGATVRILAISSDRMSGSFEMLVRSDGLGTVVRAHGTFDVPRRADDTFAGP